MMKTHYKPYQKYKPSGVEWIGEIPEGWGKRKLKFACSIKSSSVDKKDEYEKKTLIAHYNDIVANPVITKNTTFEYSSCTSSQYKSFLLNEGDLVVTKDSMDVSNIADVAIIEQLKEPTVCGYHLYIVSGNSKYIYPKYLFHLLSSRDIKAFHLVLSTGTTIIGISGRSISNVCHFLPPLPEQKAIAAFLDSETERINGVVAKQTRMIELLKEKRSALITQAVTKGLPSTGSGQETQRKMKPSGVEWIGEIPEGWEVRRWRFVAKCNPTKGEITLDSKTEVQFVPMELVPDEGVYLDLSETRQISDVINGYTYFVDGDVLIAKITPCFENGKGAIANNLKNGIGFGTTELFVYRANTKIITNRYLFQISKLKSFRSLGEAAMKGAAGQKRITDLFVKDLVIPLPPLPEQQAITIFLDRETAKIDIMVGKIEKQIELLNEYKQSLITHAVTGKIDVRGEVNA